MFKDDIKIIRVSDTKLRVKYKIPIVYSFDKGELKTSKYHDIGVTVREIKHSDVNSGNCITSFQKNYYICSRPFDKYFNKISNFYSIKKQYLHIYYIDYEVEFENITITLKIPNYLHFKGDGVKEKMRIWKIKNLLNSDFTDIQ